MEMPGSIWVPTDLRTSSKGGGYCWGTVCLCISYTATQPAICRAPCQQGSLGFWGLGLTRVLCSSISKMFLCYWNCICNPAFSNCFLVGSDLSDFTGLYTVPQAIWMYLSSLVSALSDPCKYCPSFITLLPVLISRNKKFILGNLSTSKDPWV